ncbi:protein translocase subunit SecD [Demequina lutea]|uniref:Protein translocase subunit SecD n=1 Tax=Demequina lutea TaxID=431489 RepID=A0A7Y9Z9K2_9MICO|nr:protein translocase subunit SecD [Demequina lutea]NYI41334.1 preprotein translocase subunit SecD [Demequina lutea]
MSSAVKGARRILQGLVWIIVILFAVLTLGVTTHTKNAHWLPGLGLDLAGGHEITLQAKTTDGSTVTQSDLNQAVAIIRKRVDASGTSEASITTQGNLNILVALPGNPDQATIDLVKKSAQLQFRPVLQEATSTGPTTVTPTTSPAPTGDTVSPTVLPAVPPSAASAVAPTPSASASGIDTGSPVHEMAYVKTAATPTPSASAQPAATASPTPSPTPAPTTTTAAATDPSSLSWITPEVQAAYDALDCTTPESRSGGGSLGDPNAAFATCDAVNPVKYILGPVEMDGKDVSTATSGPHLTQAGTTDGTYEVDLKLTSIGAKKFAATTARLYKLNQAGASPRDQFAMVLDGVVISAPGVRDGAINGGVAQISGSFTQLDAQTLANQLKFGALPMTLDVQSEQAISATLGKSQLENGLLAGLIGLILVVIYTLFQYRALAAVTIGSLVVAGGTTFVIIDLLSWGMGYRLSLAGVAGLIVAIGITADSFIVYFERVKDELREGRSLVAAVEHGWSRARRTILASDAVSFLAALVLYMLAVGSVRGFAFTLGLTTLVDLLVVFMFTHPTLGLLARTKFFGDGHRFSGLDPRQLGRDAVYKGRGRVSVPEVTGEPTLTLAERKAKKARAAADPAEKE